MEKFLILPLWVFSVVNTFTPHYAGIIAKG
jgi:hypothetical protein